MRNGMTYRQAIEQAEAKVARARLAVKMAEDERDAVIVAALEAGASFRDMGRELGVSATTVLRRYGAKGCLNDHVSGLDLPAAGTGARNQKESRGAKA